MKHWCFYLVDDGIGLLEADWLSPLMCINIDVLFGIIGAVRVWCDIMASAASFINIDSRCENLLAGFQNQAL